MHIPGLFFILLYINCVPVEQEAAPYQVQLTATSNKVHQFKVNTDNANSVTLHGPDTIQRFNIDKKHITLDLFVLKMLLKPDHLLWMVWPWGHATYKLTPHLKTDCPDQLGAGPIEPHLGGQRVKMQPKLGWQIQRAFDDIDTDPVLINCAPDAPDKRCLWWTNGDLVANIWSIDNPVYIDMYSHNRHKRCQLHLRLTLHLRDVIYD